MLTTLKVVMIVRGIIGILFGLSFIFVPRQLGEMFGYTAEGPEYMLSFLAMLGALMAASGVFIIAAARDPIKHIWWVKFAILVTALLLVLELYSVLMGYITFSQATMGIIMQSVFLVALLIFYPWRGPREAA
jgi:hypothetical protein